MFHKKTRSILVLVAALLTTSCDDTIIQAFEGSCSDCGSRYCCNGQCTDILSDVNACGSCEIVCKEGQLCQNGRCKTPAGSACDKGCGDNACCGDTCVDLWNDSAHCGSCDEACVQVKFAKTDIARPSVCVEKVKSVTPTAPVSHHVVAKLAQKMPSAATNPAFPAMPKIIAVLVKMPVPVKHQFALTARVSPNVTTRRR